MHRTFPKHRFWVPRTLLLKNLFLYPGKVFNRHNVGSQNKLTLWEPKTNVGGTCCVWWAFFLIRIYKETFRFGHTGLFFHLNDMKQCLMCRGLRLSIQCMVYVWFNKVKSSCPLNHLCAHQNSPLVFATAVSSLWGTPGAISPLSLLFLQVTLGLYAHFSTIWAMGGFSAWGYWKKIKQNHMSWKLNRHFKKQRYFSINSTEFAVVRF